MLMVLVFLLFSLLQSFKLCQLKLTAVFLDYLFQNYSNFRLLWCSSQDLPLNSYLNYFEELCLHFLLRLLHYQYYLHQVFLYLIITILLPPLIFLKLSNFLMASFKKFHLFSCLKVINFCL
jgi:hypothetical protein